MFHCHVSSETYVTPSHDFRLYFRVGELYLRITCLAAGGYDARMRVLVRFVSLLLQVDFDDVETYEQFVVQTFKEVEHQASEYVPPRTRALRTPPTHLPCIVLSLIRDISC